jgi:cytochrome c553
MKLKLALGAFALVAVSAIAVAQQRLDKACEGNIIDRLLCQKMINLRSQIFVLETQRELMQVNPQLLGALGRGLAGTAREALQLLGPDLPEHRQGLAGVALMADQLAGFADANDGQMMIVANSMRTNCATCHSSRNPPGNIGWDDIFQNDWSDINKFCNQPGKNPYLCKSMHAMLSTHAYHHTSFQANIENFELTRETAKEILRILGDLNVKNFKHLPDDKRLEAETAAQEVVRLTEKQDRRAFEKARGIIASCMNCHSGLSNDDGNRPWQPRSPFASR